METQLNQLLLVLTPVLFLLNLVHSFFYIPHSDRTEGGAHMPHWLYYTLLTAFFGAMMFALTASSLPLMWVPWSLPLSSPRRSSHTAATRAAWRPCGNTSSSAPSASALHSSERCSFFMPRPPAASAGTWRASRSSSQATARRRALRLSTRGSPTPTPKLPRPSPRYSRAPSSTARFLQSSAFAKSCRRRPIASAIQQ